MAQKRNTSVTELTRAFHIYPDFHGNRSPLADPEMTGMVTMALDSISPFGHIMHQLHVQN